MFIVNIWTNTLFYLGTELNEKLGVVEYFLIFDDRVVFFRSSKAWE